MRWSRDSPATGLGAEAGAITGGIDLLRLSVLSCLGFFFNAMIAMIVATAATAQNPQTHIGIVEGWVEGLGEVY